jgi:hypothetical protein
MGKNFAGYDDSRPNAAKPAPGKTDCTRRAGKARAMLAPTARVHVNINRGD